MADSSDSIKVYLEVGKSRTLTGAIEWPGWCRGGRGEAEALETLVAYGPRYERVMSAAKFLFHPPDDVSQLAVVERLAGNLTTDFGAPDIPPAVDDNPLDAHELHRLEDILQACWMAFDVTAQSARGKELRKGPRGGGRDVSEIVRHVLDAEASYVVRLGGRLPSREVSDADGGMEQALTDRRQIILDTLHAGVRGELPPQGPRGGKRWKPRYFVRRSAWHILDHLWEIEDRVI